jgi:hypothetical protein
VIVAHRPQRATRRFARLALALLLLAPLVGAAHVHGFGADASPACGVCTVAKHAPAVVATRAAVTLASVAAECVAAAPAAPLVSGRCWRPAGRAPPGSFVVPHT